MAIISKLIEGLTNDVEHFVRVYPINPKGFAQSELDGQVASAIPVGFDPNTLLLLHCDDLTDSSKNKVAITNSGVSVSTAKSKFGGKSLYFNGSSRLVINSSLFKFGTGDFTIDCWVYPESISTDNFFFSGADGNDFFFGRSGGNTMLGVGRARIAWDTTAAVSLTVGAWNHVAVSRKNGTIYFFVNGVLKSSAANTQSYNIASELNIGSQDGALYFKGYIDEMRVSDIARWTAAFSVPVAAYKY